jgi:hypothetical protein
LRNALMDMGANKSARLYLAIQATDQTLALPVWIAASGAAMTHKRSPLMPVIASRISPQSEAFKANAPHLLAQVEKFRSFERP